MDDHQLLRFNRQILLPQIDYSGQQKLVQAHVVVIGVGGLGCPVATYLAAAGVGRISLIDNDQVELTNLQRQLAYSTSDIGRAKVAVMAELLADLNPDCRVTVREEKFEPQQHQGMIESCDVIVDATDNIESRKSINQASVHHAKPLVFAAAIRMEGQFTVFDPRIKTSPCYDCVFGDVQLNESCSERGILGTVVGTLGLMQATETIKLITGAGRPPVGRLLLYDAMTSDWQSIKLTKNSDCQVCRQSS